ncbi:Ubiquinone biosynthesis O-methyltransferase [Rickettsia tillamookensis]|uniref:Ubiquinone biosynthesis O-methyltransferase n=1 Tax=Rickettsia tillamookensis TaxID=2761623 RepID=A0A9E6MHN5_9RICK|nr:Ubiquinone biosynthesis O-methyltransferase [Rickettsia tillamookensis]
MCILEKIYNDGERLIPGETHDISEVIRHKSSYKIFKKIIETDILNSPLMLNQKIKILDIGCGTGHGTFMLSDILGVEITAIDLSKESIIYAEQNYEASNIKYIESDLVSFIKKAEEYDYIVSRHALEHIEDGLNLVLNLKYKKRLIVNVPFNEAEGNIYHLVNWITEKDFESYQNKEFFYEGLDGITSDKRSEENPPNSIICISSNSDLKPVKKLFSYPITAWNPEFLEKLGLQSQGILKQLQQVQNAFKDSEEKNLSYESKLNNTVTELNNALEEIKILKNKLIISEEEKSIFLKLYRKFKQ